MAYKDPKTNILYPSKDWMIANIKNLPEVQKAYPELYQPKTPIVPTGGTTGETKFSNIPSTILPDISKLTNTGDFTIPNTIIQPKGISNATSTTSYYDTLIKSREVEADKAKAEAEKLKAETPERPKSWTDWLTGLGKPKPSEVREQGMEELGFDAKTFFAEQKASIAEIGTLTEAYNNKEAEKSQRLLTSEQRMAPMDFIRGEGALIEKTYNIELTRMSSNINAKAALLEAKSGNFQQAQNYVSQAVEDYVYELNYDYQLFDDFMTANETKIAALDKEYKNSLDEAAALKLDQLNQAKAEQTDVLNLMLQYNKAGINVGDTLTQAYQKASQWSGTQVEEVKAPETITTANGIMQWNSSTGQWEKIPGTETGIGTQLTDEQLAQQLNPANYTWDNTKLNLLTIPGSPYQRTALAYEKEAILAFAYASSGKQMSWNEAKQLYAAYIPNILDSNETKIKKLLSLESAIDQISTTAKDASLVQSQIAKQKMTQLKQELGIIPNVDSQYQQEYNQLYGEPSKKGFLQKVGEFLFGGAK